VTRLALGGSESLSRIALPEGVTRVGTYAFGSGAVWETALDGVEPMLRELLGKRLDTACCALGDVLVRQTTIVGA
jgi:hypothetical protein